MVSNFSPFIQKWNRIPMKSYMGNYLTLFWLAERVQRIFEISARDVINCRLYNNHVKDTQGHGNHVMYDRGTWFLRVIMSSSRALCCLPSVKKQKHDCIIKQLLDSVFVISRIIKVSVRVISLSLRLRLIILTSTLIILDITKTSSNNCL